MKHKYYVNKRRQTGSGKNNEVHRDGCPWMPASYYAEYLGEFDSSEDAYIFRSIPVQKFGGVVNA